jgi:hypothetical protein
MIRRSIYLASFLFLFPTVLLAQLVRPIQSESMYKQLRSMETGPWEFAPDHYYYSWVTRSRKLLFVEWTWKEPGFGWHDRGPAGIGWGDGYVNKYKPNAQVRAKMLAFTEITRKQYEAVAELHKKVGERELVDATDRRVNLAIRVYESRIQMLKDNIRSQCQALREVKGGGYASAKDLEGFYLRQLARIEENIDMIGKSYVKNSERSSAYLKEIKNLIALSRKVRSACRYIYADKKYSESI